MAVSNITDKYRNFLSLSFDEQIEIKRIGRPKPNLNIECWASSRKKTYTRKFNKDVYDRYNWLCGCEIKNSLFCFPCLLYGGDPRWTINGVTDLVHIIEKTTFHENSRQHLSNKMRYVLLGKTNIRQQLDSSCCESKATCYEIIAKNRFDMLKIVNAIISCKTFKIIHDTSDHYQISRIDYISELYKILEENLLESKIVYKGSPEELLNYLLYCIFDTYRDVVSTEIEKTNFLGVVVHETIDIVSDIQDVLVFRYVINGKAVERFWGIFNPDALNASILNELEPLTVGNPRKLIAQSYDGAPLIGERQRYIEAKIKEKYPGANVVQCYAHKLSSIMIQAASQNNDVNLFFGNLSEIPAFFFDSFERLDFLIQVAKIKSNNKTPPTQKDFENRTVNVVYEYREELMECMEVIEGNPGANIKTKIQAGAIRRLLQEKSFVFWLTFFHHVMPHVDILFEAVQNRIIDSEEIANSLETFKDSITIIRNETLDDIMQDAKTAEVIEPKRRRLNEDFWKTSAVDVCDVMVKVAEDRFQPSNQLNAANLFICEKFQYYNMSFPSGYLKQTVDCYPSLVKNRLKTELSILYLDEDYRNVPSCAALLRFLVDNELQEVFRDTVNLLKILVTMPMTSVEAERDVAVLKRIKTFLGSAVCRDNRRNALACLAVEQKFIRTVHDFNEKVIEKFAQIEDGCVNLVYKEN